MTVQDCIDYVDSIEPNAYTDAQKTGWLNEAEGKVYTQLFLVQPMEFTPLTDGDQILTLPAPHDRMYRCGGTASECFTGGCGEAGGHDL